MYIHNNNGEYIWNVWLVGNLFVYAAETIVVIVRLD